MDNRTRRKSCIWQIRVEKNNPVILAVDYSSRKAFAQCIRSKAAKTVVKFIQFVYHEFPFKQMLTDNGREFNNKLVQECTKALGVYYSTNIPFYHESNRRIEPLNRKIRDGHRQSGKKIKLCLNNVIDTYNMTIHRGPSKTPNKACDPLNRLEVVERSARYMKGLLSRRKRKQDEFAVGVTFLVRNENRMNKMDDEFKDSGTIVKKSTAHVYEIQTSNKRLI